MHWAKVGILSVGAIAVGVAVFDDLKTPRKPIAEAEKPAATAQAQEPLSTLIPSCVPGGRISCTDDLYQKVWIRLEADNGEVTKVDTRSIDHVSTGAAEVVVYTYVPNTRFDPSRLRRLFFDCAGQFRDETEGFSRVMDAPPQSIAGRVAAIACAAPMDTH
jgi:hypothetical protein